MAPDAPVIPTISRCGAGSDGIKVMYLHQQAAGFRFERTMISAGRPARIGGRLEGFAAIALLVISDSQIARKQKHFFPVFVNERHGRINARREAKQTCPAATFVNLIERS